MNAAVYAELDRMAAQWRRRWMTLALFVFNVGLYLHVALTLYRGHP